MVPNSNRFSPLYGSMDIEEPITQEHLDSSSITLDIHNVHGGRLSTLLTWRILKGTLPNTLDTKLRSTYKKLDISHWE